MAARISQEQALTRAIKLMALATHKDTPGAEAERAAATACKYIRKYGLKCKVFDGPEESGAHPAVQTLKNVADIVNDPDIQAAAGAITGAAGMAMNAFRKRRRR